MNEQDEEMGNVEAMQIEMNEDEPEPIIVVDGHCILGHVCGGKFHKSFCSSLFLDEPPSILIGVGELRYAECAGAVEVEIVDAKHRLIYGACIATIWASGMRLNSEGGEQIGLHLDYWTQSGVGADKSSGQKT